MHKQRTCSTNGCNVMNDKGQAYTYNDENDNNSIALNATKAME